MENYVAFDGTPAAAAARLINFTTAKADLLPGHKKWLDEKVIPAIRARPNAWIDLYGYASKRGNRQFNLGLSKNRAKAPKNYLAGTMLLLGKSIDQMVKIDHGFGEDHPDYFAKETDNAAYWRAAEVIVFGTKPKIVRPPAPVKPTATNFEIRVVGGGSASIIAQTDDYFFQIVDILRQKTMFFLYTGLGIGISIPKIPGPGSVTKAGPPTKFTTTRPAELYQFNSRAQLFQDPGATLGGASVGGTLRLSINEIHDSTGMIFTKPGIIPIEGGAGIQMPGVGSVSEGVLAKVSAEFPFTGY
jgi:hypothetical protein